MKGSIRFEKFVEALTRLIDGCDNEATLRRDGHRLLETLIAHDDWLPDAFAQPDAKYYQQYPLHVDPQGRFSVVSFVWGPGQNTPVHNHTVWGLIGMLRGGERSERFEFRGDGQSMRYVGEETLHPGEVDEVSPTIGDIHRVSNLYDDRVSISVHVYGGDIGRISRHVFDPHTGAGKAFVSGYSSRGDEDSDEARSSAALPD
jgi:predicted metal-dependent enzyme (double-stranded beta helix superfamily)